MAKELYEKLGIRSGMKIYLKNEPSNYIQLLGKVPEDVHILSRKTKSLDFIHLFCADSKTLEKEYFPLKKAMAIDGIFWISWLKKSAGIPSDLNREILRDFVLANGLVDVKVASVNETWSSLKFVYRLKDR